MDYVLSHDRAWTPTRLDHPAPLDRQASRRPGGWKPSRLTRTLFVERFGGVYEHSPWIAVVAYDAGLHGGSGYSRRPREGDGGGGRQGIRG